MLTIYGIHTFQQNYKKFYKIQDRNIKNDL